MAKKQPKVTPKQKPNVWVQFRSKRGRHKDGENQHVAADGVFSLPDNEQTARAISTRLLRKVEAPKEKG